MGQRRMGTHSDSAFNESEEIRQLSGVLEEKKTIKCFFKENDRTPNYDGSFELVATSREPIKQFIVQIKKVEGLRKNKKGMYPYDLETKFLYYVKEKVIESPAIYFVVDILLHQVFYLYLSDDVLMSLNFEGKEAVRYHFSEDNIINNIDDFYAELFQIAQERNSIFLNKSREEIVAMQEAIERLNELMNNDLATIKDAVFPGLWRFGLASSVTDSLKLTSYDKDGNEIVIANGKANAFGIYPQIKGIPNNEISEYRATKNIMFSSFDFTERKSIDDYVNEIIQKIVRQFCENPPFELLPDIILNEMIAHYRKRLYSIISDRVPNTVKKSIDDYNRIIHFVEYFVAADNLSNKEKAIRNQLFPGARIKKNSISVIVLLTQCLGEYEKYVKEKPLHGHLNPHTIVNLLSIEDLKYFLLLNEMNRRGMDEINAVWEYDVATLYNRKEKQIEDVKEICNKWFAELPKIYTEFYNRIFKIRDYKYSCKVKYCIEAQKSFLFEGEWEPCCRSWTYRIPQNHEITINYQDNLVVDIEKVEEEVVLIGQGASLVDYLKKREQTLYYDGIRMWLYDGVMHELGMKNKWKKLFEMPHDDKESKKE